MACASYSDCLQLLREKVVRDHSSAACLTCPAEYNASTSSIGSPPAQAVPITNFFTLARLQQGVVNGELLDRAAIGMP